MTVVVKNKIHHSLTIAQTANTSKQMKNITPKQLTMWLKAKGLSQNKFAKTLGLHPGTVSNWKKRGISFKNQIKISEIMNGGKNGKSTK